MSLYKKGSPHYKLLKIQPIKFINENRLLFAEGNVIQYICRHNKPTGNGAADIDKAIHYLEFIKERDYSNEI